MTDKPAIPDFARCYIDLAQPRLGAEVLEASDDFFAPKERLIKPQEPIFIDDKYDDHGKWMDGWESRRKREEGHDYCILKICPGTIYGVNIDTRFFTGNYPPYASLEACYVDGYSDEQPDWESCEWTELVSRTELQGDQTHFLEVENRQCWTHLRLNIFPDGGIARLRVYGEAHCEPVTQGDLVDLAAMENGGRALACNDMHYGHMSNVIAPGKGINMGDGWETRRRRNPGHDWLILKLAYTGKIRQIEVDTAYFKGNYPHHCAIYGLNIQNLDVDESTIDPKADYWQEILPYGELGPDAVHLFEQEVARTGAVTHVLLNIFPDGGVSRLRLYGTIDA